MKLDCPVSSCDYTAQDKSDVDTRNALFNHLMGSHNHAEVAETLARWVGDIEEQVEGDQ